MTTIKKDRIFNELKVTTMNKIPIKSQLNYRGKMGEIVFEAESLNFYYFNGTNWQTFSTPTTLALVLSNGNDAGGQSIVGVQNFTTSGVISAPTLAISGNLSCSNIYNANVVTASLFSGGVFSGDATAAQQLIPGSNINNVLFTGASNITITAFSAELVYGATLAPNILYSGLQTVGPVASITLAGNLSMQGNDILSVNRVSASSLQANSLTAAVLTAVTLAAGNLTATFLTSPNSTTFNVVSAGTLTTPTFNTTTLTATGVTLSTTLTVQVPTVNVNFVSATTLQGVNLFANGLSSTFLGAITVTISQNAEFINLSTVNLVSNTGTGVTLLLCPTITITNGLTVGATLQTARITVTNLSTPTATITRVTAESVVASTITGGTIGGNWAGREILVEYGGTSRSTWTPNEVLWASSSTIISQIPTINDAVLLSDGSGVPYFATTLPTAFNDSINYLGTLTTTLNMGGYNIVNVNIYGASLLTGNISSYERVSYPQSTLNPNLINSIIQSASISVKLTLGNPTLDVQEKFILATTPEAYLNPITLNNVQNSSLPMLYNHDSLQLVWDAVNQTWINRTTTVKLAPGSYSNPSLAFLQNTNTGVFSPGPNSLSLVTAGKPRVNIDSAGNITTPSNPAFSAYLPTSITFTSGTIYPIAGLTTRYDRNSNFNRTTGVFTAPITGAYYFNGLITLNTLTASNISCSLSLFKNNVAFNYVALCNPYALSTTLGDATLNFNSMNYLATGDTLDLRLHVTGGNVVGLTGSSGDSTNFSGYLIG